MESKFKIFTGVALQVEKDLNNIKRDTTCNICIVGMSATNESTTVIVEIFPL